MSKTLSLPKYSDFPKQVKKFFKKNSRFESDLCQLGLILSSSKYRNLKYEMEQVIGWVENISDLTFLGSSVTTPDGSVVVPVCKGGLFFPKNSPVAAENSGALPHVNFDSLGGKDLPGKNVFVFKNPYTMAMFLKRRYLTALALGHMGYFKEDEQKSKNLEKLTNFLYLAYSATVNSEEVKYGWLAAGAERFSNVR